MMNRSCLALCLSLLLIPGIGFAQVVLSEIVPDNGPDGFKSAEGFSLDWIELHNTGASSVDLLGSFLTDDATILEKWEFERSFVIPPGGFRVVFASDQDGLIEGEEHTNFKLNSGGEYLALVDSDGTTILSEFAPNFPSLARDLAFGRVSSGAILGVLETASPNAVNSGAAPEAKTLSLIASETTVAGGADLTLTWQTENATSVELAVARAPHNDHFSLIATVAANDSIVVNPTRNSIYRIRAINAYGFDFETVAISVGPQLLQFSASPTTIASGGSTMLRWQAGGTDISLDVNGTSFGPGEQSTLFQLSNPTFADVVVPVTMTVSNASGSVSSTVNVTVLAQNSPLPPLPPLVVSELYWSYQGTFILEPYRFIELHNRGAEPIDLDGFQIAGTARSDLSLAEPRVVQPDDYVLLIANPVGFADIWPGERPVIGMFDLGGQFVYDLEFILMDQFGRTIEGFQYNQPLPRAGIFHPIQRIDETLPPTYPDNWIVSPGENNGNGSGTPGEAPFVILSFTADPPFASPGDTVTIEWETSREVPLTISHDIGPVTGLAGSIPFTIPLDATEVDLTLVAQTTFNSVSTSLHLALPPTIRSFWASETAISRDDETKLYWNFKGTRLASVRIDPEIGGWISSPHTFTPLVSGFPVGSVWRYLRNGNGQGPEWRDPDLDERAWRYGTGIFGYGNDIETTVLAPGDWVTTYFRRHFHSDETDQIESLTVDLLIDDGAEVYLNGTEVLRELLPEGEIDFNSQAAGMSPNDGREYRTFNIDSGALVEGDNVIAVGAHNNIPNAEDFGFDLGLSSVKSIPASGRKDYTLAVTNPAGQANATITILFEERTNLADWYIAHGLSGDPVTKDTDLDGLTDLMEFATGSDPLAASPPPITLEFDEDGKLLVSFPRHLSRNDVLLRAEISTDLRSWKSLEDDFVFEGGIAPDGSSVAESLHRSYAPVSGTLYLRLQASLIP